MICLSGDLHHMSLNTGNQQHCDITELQVGRRYLEMLQAANVKVTYFISGKCFAEEWDEHLQFVVDHPLVEVAGHNFSCFTPELWHRISKKLLGSYNGPAWYQKRDARLTQEIIRQCCGKTISCWRNHMYMHGPHTERVLRDCGLKICSDGVKKDAHGPVWHETGMLNFPLNVMPDHEHLYHAERSEEWVAWWQKRYHWSDDYGPDSYYIEEWTERVLDELKGHEANGVLSNMIIHPITLYLADGLKSFESRLLPFISDCKTVHMNEVYEAAVKEREAKSG